MTTVVKESTGTARAQKYFGAYREPLAALPNLVEPQIASFRWLVEKGLAEVLREFSSIKDYSGKKFELDFTGFKLSEPKHDEFYAKQNKLSFEGQLKVTVRLKNKVAGGKIIPARGAWIEIETEADGGIYVRIDRKRKFPVTALLRILAAGDTAGKLGALGEKELSELFRDNPHAAAHLTATLA